METYSVFRREENHSTEIKKRDSDSGLYVIVV